MLKIHGVTGDNLETNGQIGLSLGENSPHRFLVVKSLRMECEILLVQDFLERFGYQFQIPCLGINLPAYSETLVRIPTTEQGNRFFEAQELRKNIFCASSVVECRFFIFCLINLNSLDETLMKFPRTQELPKLSSRFKNARTKNRTPEIKYYKHNYD